MSDRSYWFNRARYTRVEDVGIDSSSRLATKTRVVIFDNEPCDLVERTRTTVVEGPGGHSQQVVMVPMLKIYPRQGIVAVPDENDTILVDGQSYQINTVQNYWDAGSGKYMGTELSLERVERTDTR